MKFLSSFVTPLTLLSAVQASTDHENTIVYYRQRMSQTSASDSLCSFLNNHNHDDKSSSLRQLQAENDTESMLNCNHEAIKEWVMGNVAGGRCEDFAEVLGGMELCQEYEDYQDPMECFNLDDTPSFNLGAGGLGPSPVEECLYFVNHLLPHPYFLDLDSILPVFGSGFDFPSRHDCTESTTEECPVEIRYEQEYAPEFLEELGLNFTAAPTPAPRTDTVPCTRCDFEYESDDVCFEAPCEYFNCEEPTRPLDVPPENRTIQVCFQNTRSDLFGFTEHRMGDFYGCSISTEEKTWTTHFDKGVVNIQHMEFTIGEYPEQAGLSYCQLSVDGVLCNSCEFCSVNDTNPHVAMDCENILPGGSTSCDVEEDFVFGIARKLITLQDEPTEAPTMAPQQSPAAVGEEEETASQSDNDTEESRDFFDEDLEANEMEGFDVSGAARIAGKGAAFTLVALVAVFGFL